MNTTTAPPPLTLEQFEEIYQKYLGPPHYKTAYFAYLDAEAEVERTHGERKYKNHQSFMSARTNRNRRSASPIDGGKGGEQQSHGKVPIKCQICTAELYHVPRGDFRTIIPHICDGCRDEIRKLIL